MMSMTNRVNSMKMVSYSVPLFDVGKYFKRGWRVGMMVSGILILLGMIKFFNTVPMYESYVIVKIGQVSYFDHSWTRTRVFLEDPQIVTRRLTAVYGTELSVGILNDGFMDFRMIDDNPQKLKKKMSELLQGLLSQHDRLYQEWQEKVVRQLKRVEGDLALIQHNMKENSDTKTNLKRPIDMQAISPSRSQQFVLEQLQLGLFSNPTSIIREPSASVPKVGPDPNRYIYIGGAIVILAGLFTAFVIGFFSVPKE
ncbi:MAG: hypothetical protein NPIRA02_16140 [Nitrospirales bacterium]|nr:MAG: hypothetical protein NPIRA02_16140 [Nitrospirales bacterium]